MYIVNIVVVAVVLIGLVAILLYIDVINQLLSTKKFFNQVKNRSGFTDILNYAAVIEDGIIINKDGSFLAAFEYSTQDTASSSDQEQELLSNFINRAIKELGAGWIINVDHVRKETDAYSSAKDSHFPDVVSSLIDQERRSFFEAHGSVYQGKSVITVIWNPPLLAQQKIQNMMFIDTSEKKQSTHEEMTNALISKFKEGLFKLEQSLSVAVNLERLGVRTERDPESNKPIQYDALLEHLNLCITGNDHPVRVPSQCMYIDQLIGSHDFFSAVTPKLDDTYIGVINIEGFPADSYPGILNALTQLSCEYRWSTRFVFMDEFQSIAVMTKYFKKWRQKIRGFWDQLFNTNSGRYDADALAMMEDAEVSINDVKSQLVAAGLYTSVVVLYDKDRDNLQEQLHYVQREIMRLGFGARIETINATAAYIDSLPGHYYNLRQPIMHTLNFADLIPSNTIWTGAEKCPNPFYPQNSPALMYCVTNGSTPFRLNLSVRDLGHTLIFGPTGSGKSTLLATLAAQFRRYEGMHIYAFDKGMSMYPLTKAVGGQHFALGGSEETQLNFCPLQYLETASDQAWAAGWIEDILTLNGMKVSPMQRNAIADAIKTTSESVESKSLTEFLNNVQDNEIRDTLKPYTIAGLLGNLLDATSDGLDFSNFCTFEIEDLMNLNIKYSLPVLLYLFRRIEKNLKGQPSVIFLDEAWLMLGNDVFKEKIREWLKVLRKANCSVVMATQSLSDASNSGILDVITESTASKIFLANVYATDEMNAKLYRSMGLNDRQIQIVSTMVPKRQYFYVSEEGRRLFELALGKLSLAFVGASDKDSIAKIKELEATWGEQWVYKWMEENYIDYRKYGEIK